MAAMRGRPVVEPRTARPGLGGFRLVISQRLLSGLRFCIRNIILKREFGFRNTKEIAMPRLDPVLAPYTPEVAARLEAMMPPGVPPILLFRTFARNLPMAGAMGEWGSYELSKRCSLSMRDREIVIDRTCARCGCEYEWGVHVAFYAERVGFSDKEITSLTHGSASDECWTEERDRILIATVDELFGSAQISDDLWRRLSEVLTDEQILDVLLMTGWYHAICFAANGVQLALEPGAPRFADVA
jgi:alkylhydroperoxidase family enzyme